MATTLAFFFLITSASYLIMDIHYYRACPPRTVRIFVGGCLYLQAIVLFFCSVAWLMVVEA